MGEADRVDRVPEIVLSLIGTIIRTLWMFFVAGFSIYMSLLPRDEVPFGLVAFLFASTIILILLAVFNWIGIFKLRKKPKGWGIYFLVTGIICINIWSIIAGGMLLGRHPKPSVSLNAN